MGSNPTRVKTIIPHMTSVLVGSRLESVSYENLLQNRAKMNKFELSYQKNNMMEYYRLLWDILL